MIAQKIIIGIIIAGFLIAVALSSAQAGEVIDLGPEKCKHGLLFQPNGPFAVMLFCEDALGSHIGVIYYKIMGVPLEGKWNLTDRFWQHPDWGADITAVAWDSTGKYLLVSTSKIYGTGAVYSLDLMNRKAKKIFPHKKYAKEAERIKEICTTKILGLDEKKKVVDILLEDCDSTMKIQLRVEY